MKTFHKILLLLSLSLGITSTVKSQDFHMSQYDAFPLYLNPALTGMRMDGDWDYRINANYKEQSNYLGQPFQTVAAGFDMPLSSRFSIGQYIIDNQGANGYFNTLNFVLSGSYKVSKPTSDNPHQISVGLQLGLMQKSVNNATFTYDAQYDPLSSSGFNAALPTGESYNRQTIESVDANMGIFYKYVPENKKVVPFFGFAIYHLTNPYTSFTGQSSFTPMRFTFYGGCYYTVSEEIRLLPKFLVMNQANVTEINIGLDAFYTIAKTDYEPFIGLSYRKDDAFIFGAGLKTKSYIGRISYDLNSSYLRTYSLGKGGVELSFIYTGKKKAARAEKYMPRF